MTSVVLSHLPSPLLRSRTFGRRDIWAQGRLGAGACASEILGVGQSSNVYAISGKHCFHQSNFYFRQHRLYPVKIYLLRIFALIKPLFSSEKDYFHQNNSLHLEIIHCNPSKDDYNFHFSWIMIFSLIPLSPTPIETACAQTAGPQKSRTPLLPFVFLMQPIDCRSYSVLSIQR